MIERSYLAPPIKVLRYATGYRGQKNSSYGAGIYIYIPTPNERLMGGGMAPAAADARGKKKQ